MKEPQAGAYFLLSRQGGTCGAEQMNPGDGCGVRICFLAHPIDVGFKSLGK